VASGIFIITGTPFLVLDEHATIILGDIHLGQESSLFRGDTNKVSNSCRELTQLLVDCINKFKIQRVICNGDIKHHSSSIKIQELEELKFFVRAVMDVDCHIDFIQGNHDRLLEFLFPHIDMEKFQLQEKIEINQILIHHGHLDIESSADVIIISHEHPAFTFYGMNRARLKLPAFVILMAAAKEVIILPAANSISLGTNYPPQSRGDFLSPFLQEHAELKTIEIFPYDREVGLLELPPVFGNNE